MTGKKPIVDVIIVGGGMAGLSACESLVKSDYNVVLVEANNYLGGRVYQAEYDSLPPIDMGGEIIHGCNTRVHKMAVEFNWDIEMLFDYVPEHGLEWIFMDGEMYPYHSTQEDIVSAYMSWGDFVYTNKPSEIAKEDTTAAEYFKKHAKTKVKSQHIFDVVFCQTEATTLDALGGQEHSDFQNGWECGEGNFRLKHSHRQVVDFFRNECKGASMKLKWPVKAINYSTSIITVTNDNGEDLLAHTVIVTVPLTVLKDEDIAFVPQLPQDKLLAISKLQMFTGLKIVCFFDEKFWDKSIHLVFNCMSDISQLWMYEVTEKKTGEKRYVVTGFQTAEYARQKVHMTGEEIKDIFLDNLNEMFGTKEKPTPATNHYLYYVYHHWSSNPFIRGAYSSPSLHARGQRQILAKPLQNRIFFAGEATRSRGDCATVSGAMESGIEAANDVKTALSFLKRCS